MAERKHEDKDWPKHAEKQSVRSGDSSDAVDVDENRADVDEAVKKRYREDL